MSDNESRLTRNARILLDACYQVKANDTVVILTTKLNYHGQALLPYAEALEWACAERGAFPTILYLNEAIYQGYAEEKRHSEAVRAAIRAADIVINMADCRPSLKTVELADGMSTAALARKRGYRLQTLNMDQWDIEPEQITRIPERNRWLLDIVSRARGGRITTPCGTDFEFGLGPGAIATPILCMPFYGEISIFPKPGTCNGVLMIDRTTTGGNVWGTTANTVVRPLEEIDREPLRITIENSVVKDAAGETGQLNRLQRYLTDNAPRPDQVEEVGLVTTQVKENDAWWRDRAHDHDCAHIALGNNYGKKDGIHCKCHMDMQMFRPTIWLDGIMVEKDGVFCDENLNGRPADMARRKADVEPQTGVNGMIVRKTSNMV